MELLSESWVCGLASATIMPAIATTCSTKVRCMSITLPEAAYFPKAAVVDNPSEGLELRHFLTYHATRGMIISNNSNSQGYLNIIAHLLSAFYSVFFLWPGPERPETASPPVEELVLSPLQTSRHCRRKRYCQREGGAPLQT